MESTHTQHSPIWRVLKFGGTSVRDAERIRHVASLVDSARSRADRIVVVVSALGGSTDLLLEVHQDTTGPALDEIAERHREAARELADEIAIAAIEELLAELREFALAAPIQEQQAGSRRDHLMSFGERLATELVAAALRSRGLNGVATDLRSLVRTDDDFGNAQVLQPATREALSRHCSSLEETAIPVCTGFLGQTNKGLTTTLGRGGSDLTASLVGSALHADEIEIWTDVDGVLSADPRVVDTAFSIDRLSYAEIMELAHFGAKVLYPPSVAPARDANVPLSVRNTLNPDFPGTEISDHQPAARSSFTGITSIEEVTMLTLKGPGMLGVTGISERLFGALARARCNVILISQASSEHAICCAVAPERAEAGCREANQEFAAERASGRVHPIDAEPHQSVVAVVGEGMREQPGIAGRVFSVLGANAINVRAIAQGCSERNISMVVGAGDRDRTVRALHRELFESPSAVRAVPRQLAVVVAGIGGVGAELLHMLNTDGRFILSGVLSSRFALFTEEQLRHTSAATSDDWRRLLQQHGRLQETRQTLTEIASLRAHSQPLAFADCTASTQVAGLYPLLLNAGSNVVAANKLAFAADDAEPSWFTASAAERIRFEATVGAGLPVVQTLRALQDCGDVIHEISGVFSGTIGYLLSQVRDGDRVSKAIRQAYDQGYTEPDPREDLSGADVARKLLILARLCGTECTLGNIALHPLLEFSAADNDLDVTRLWPVLERFDEEIERAREAARARDSTIVYLARAQLNPGTAPRSPQLSVGLTELPADHPACQLRGTENMFLFHTNRYTKDAPLIVRGPGAGTTVTAAGMLDDLLSLHRTHCGGRW